MLRKSAIIGAIVAMFALVAMPAGAADSTDSATLSVTVPTSITITFTDDSADFGTVAAGAQATQLDTLSYTVETNHAAGFNVDIETSGFSSFVGFSLSKDGFATAGTPVPDGGTDQLVANDWRSETTLGSFNYSDDVRVDVGTTQAAATYNRTLDYIATTI